MRKLLLLGLLSPAISAQVFTDLATNSDGSLLFFVSPLRQMDTDQVVNEGKIFRAAGVGLDLAAQPQCTVMPLPDIRGCDLSAPDISADGKVLAYTFRQYDMDSGANVTEGLVLPSPFFERRVAGRRVHISRNARFVLAFSDVASVAPQIIDLATNSTTVLSAFSVIGDAKQAVADDGTVVLRDASEKTVLWKSGSVTPLNLKHQSGNVRIDSGAHVVVYEWADSQYHLNVYDIATGADTPLWSEGIVPPSHPGSPSPTPLYYQPSISGDGRYVLVQEAHASLGGPKDLWILATDGSNARQLTSHLLVAADVLSDDGVIAYASTLDNRIVRVNTVSVEQSEVVGRTPVLSPHTGSLTIAPGDFIQTGGSGLDNVTVLVNGEPAWVIAAHSEVAAFRIPWDVPVGEIVEITAASASPFAPGSLSAAVAAAHARPWISLPIHQDFSNYVLSEAPAKPGEVVHLYLTGLGRIEPLLGLDQPAPVGTLFRAATPLECTAAPGITAPVLFAGVAPGQTWIYQADVQIPDGATNGTLACSGATFPLSTAMP